MEGMKEEVQASGLILVTEETKPEPEKPKTEYQKWSAVEDAMIGLVRHFVPENNDGVEQITISCIFHPGCCPRTTVFKYSETGEKERVTLRCFGCHPEDWTNFIKENSWTN